MCDSQLKKVSSCDSYLEKVSSVESLPPPPKSFEIVPELKGYKFKLLTETQQEVSFEYDLKPGRILPYSVKLKGTISFRLIGVHNCTFFILKHVFHLFNNSTFSEIGSIFRI